MRIAFCGKGGSGKTTIASLFIRYLINKGDQILAIDGDINQHLSEALALDPVKVRALPRLGQNAKILRDYIAGTNARLKADQILESTPAGNGSNFMTFAGNDPVSRHFILRDNNLRFMAVGGHQDHDLGTTCFHKFTGAEGIFLNHLLDSSDEFVIGDMCAGADPFASSGLASRYDAIYLVLEPTLKSIGVYKQAKQYTQPFGIPLFIIGNKIASPDDIDFIQLKTKQKLLCAFGDMDVIRNFEKGHEFTVSDLDRQSISGLETMRKTALSMGGRDWDRYIENGKFFHKRAAEGWGNSMYGTDLMQQIDPDFSYGAALSTYEKAT